MRLLLDTRVWLWFESSPNRLHDSVVALLEDERSEPILSAASAWEIAIKYAIGKLPLPEPPTSYVPSRVRRSGITVLPIELRHAVGVSTLPDHHRDPIDRMLVSQAVAENIPVLTVDSIFRRYPVSMIDARRPFAGSQRS